MCQAETSSTPAKQNSNHAAALGSFAPKFSEIASKLGNFEGSCKVSPLIRSNQFLAPENPSRVLFICKGAKRKFCPYNGTNGTKEFEATTATSPSALLVGSAEALPPGAGSSPPRLQDWGDFGLWPKKATCQWNCTPKFSYGNPS